MLEKMPTPYTYQPCSVVLQGLIRVSVGSKPGEQKYV